MIVFSAVSYTIVGVLYAVFCILLLMSWRGQQVGAYLIAACGISALWAFVLAMQNNQSPQFEFAMFSVEVFRGGAWLAFLTVLLTKMGINSHVRFAVHSIWIGVLVTGSVAWVAGRDSALSLNSIAVMGGLLVALAGLVSIEQLYRNSLPQNRWALKSLAIGLGGMFAYDLFLYSQGLTFGVLDPATWNARGAVNILFVPLIAISARRNPEWDLDIFVSRQVVFYSTSLIVVGCYLLLMSFGGYALIVFGGAWGALAQIVFLAGAALILLAVLFSGSMRARARVLLSKHFFRNKYDYREEWLRLISTLGELEGGSTGQIIVKAMAQIVNSPGGYLWSVDKDKRTYRLSANFGEPDSAPDLSADSELVAFIKNENWLIDLVEYEQSPDLYGRLTIPTWFDARPKLWLVVPLMFQQELLGLVMLTKASGSLKLNYEDRDLLKTVGNHLAVHLAQETADSLLSEAQQFEAYNRLTAFLMHDLKNLVAQQSLIIRNAEIHKRNPEFVDDAMQTIANSVDRMKHVMDQLKRGDTVEITKKTELRFIVSTAVDRCSGDRPVPTTDIDGVDVSITVDVEQFIMVLTHLIKNAQDATPADGQIIVAATHDSESVRVTITDNGAGMTPDYVRDYLFKPFESTKGSQGMGIGAYQAREFSRKMGGELRVQSDELAGTSVTLILPLKH